MTHYYADFHTHSDRSPDAFTSMTEMARAGIRAGMQELCFTDHVDPYSIYRVSPDGYDWDALQREFHKAQDACGDEIILRLGIELGQIGRDYALTERLMSTAPPLDFIIGSVHELSQKRQFASLFLSEERDEGKCRELLDDYLDAVLEMVQWGQFHVVGHLTLPLRYMNENLGLHMEFDGFEDKMEHILQTVIDNGLGIELNTNRGNRPLPDDKWLKLYRNLGGTIITTGSDAHTPKYVGCAIQERQQLLRDCGFTAFCTFTGGKPIFHPL